MTLRVAPPPFNDPLVDENGYMSSEFFNWLQIVLLPSIEQTPSVFGNTPAFEVTNQNASIAGTPLPLGSLSAGYYRVTVWMRITTPAGVASSVTPFFTFTDGGVACTVTGSAMTSNAINQPDSQTFLLSVDAPGPISFGTTYVSNPAGAAVYETTVTVERVQ
jgi:hypothetical protein